eukprot:s207_g26.t1
MASRLFAHSCQFFPLVGAALCKMYSCAALQQLEEAAEMRSGRKDKKGRAKKRLQAQAAWDEAVDGGGLDWMAFERGFRC